MAGAIKGVGFLVILGLFFLLLASATAPITADLARDAGESVSVNSSTGFVPSEDFKAISLAEEIDLSLYKGHTSPDHSPLSEAGQVNVKQLIWRVEIAMSDPDNSGKTVPSLYCAFVALDGAGEFIRVLAIMPGESSGLMGWFSLKDGGWKGIFPGKDALGFLSGWPRGANEYIASDDIFDCIAWLGGKMPAGAK